MSKTYYKKLISVITSMILVVCICLAGCTQEQTNVTPIAQSERVYLSDWTVLSPKLTLSVIQGGANVSVDQPLNGNSDGFYTDVKNQPANFYYINFTCKSSDFATLKIKLYYENNQNAFVSDYNSYSQPSSATICLNVGERLKKVEIVVVYSAAGNRITVENVCLTEYVQTSNILKNENDSIR